MLHESPAGGNVARFHIREQLPGQTEPVSRNHILDAQKYGEKFQGLGLGAKEGEGFVSHQG
jgi:hypothetical protein